MINPDYVSNQKTVAQFLAYLRSLPEVPDTFIRILEDRATGRGRSLEQLDYLGRDVRVESLAMAADLAIQAHYYLLQCEKNEVEPNLGAAMEAATYAAKAWEAIKRL